MDKEFTEIGIQIPDGFTPVRFVLEGQMLRIYLSRRKEKWELHEIEYHPTPN